MGGEGKGGGRGGDGRGVRSFFLDSVSFRFVSWARTYIATDSCISAVGQYD